MRFESTFCDVLLTNFIVGLRLFPELAELGAEDAAVAADAAFEIKKGLLYEHEICANFKKTRMMASVPYFCTITNFIIWQP